jgi:6-pyruvoyl-tetrahydropterin synthase
MQLFVNDLTVMDFSYLCPTRGMVGESWLVDVILNGSLNEESMVQDFGLVKKKLKGLIDLHVDHKLLVPAEHGFSVIEKNQQDNQVGVIFNRPDNKQIALNCPDEAYAFIYSDRVDMDSVREYLQEVIATHLPENVDKIELRLRCEEINTPYYHYTHGLKKHDGNCQRIAHGHRSRIEILLEGRSSHKWEAYWAERWRDIYVGSQEDLVAWQATSLQPLEKDDHFVFAYDSSQGRFELAIPKSECEIIATDSTVECLAQFIANEMHQQEDAMSCQVIAYEGVGKGAMAYG